MSKSYNAQTAPRPRLKSCTVTFIFAASTADKDVLGIYLSSNYLYTLLTLKYRITSAGSNSSLVFAVQNSNIPIRAFIFIYIFNEVVPDFNKSCSRDLCLCPYYLLPNISGTDRKVYMGYPRRLLDLRESKKSTEETV